MPPEDEDTTVEAPEVDAEEVETDEVEDDQPLGPAGEKALAAEKDRRKAESAKRRAAEDKIKALEAQLNKPSDGAEPDVESIRADAVREANQAAAQRIIKSEVKAAAAGKLADPADAYKFLDLSEFEVDEDGNVDESEVADAITELLERKPYLAAQGGIKKQHGSADGGARKGSKPDLRQQLADATARGDHLAAIAIKQRLAAELQGA